VSRARWTGAFQLAESGNPFFMSRRARYSSNEAAKAVVVLADLTALILGLWILFALLDANRANDLVNFVHAAAGWLAGWSHDLFTMDTEWVRTVLNYGLPAVIYLCIGHVLAARIRRP
jgi:hypothetical protein